MNKPAPKGRNDDHEMTYTQIMEGLFLGSDFCKGGVCLIHGEEFKRLEVSYEINLSDEGNELPPTNLSGYLWLPVVDGNAPAKEQMEIGVDYIHRAVENGKNVYVHCKNGHGRSPTLIAAYLKRHKGMTAGEAIKFLESKRKEIHIEKIQRKAVEEF